MADMKQYGIELEVIPIKQQNTKFDYELFYDVSTKDKLSLYISLCLLYSLLFL